MWAWLRGKRPEPLHGAPAVRRSKTYSSASGYVFLYSYLGMRRARRGREIGAEYVFDVSTGKKRSFAVPVFLPDSSLDGPQCRLGRQLASTECYALAKMGLFQAFDERAGPGQMRERILLREADVEAILETLGID